MTMKRKLIVSHGRQMAFALCGLLMSAWSLQSCSDDDNAILTGQPSWLGNSIYERLKEDPDGQKYSTLLRLIDELGQKDVLSQTGSKTIFAADDAAFDRWFKTNKWGARSYEALTKAQKTMLLNTAMVNNAYLIEMLSNSEGDPVEKGGSMRRLTASSIYDSVPTLDPNIMPKTIAWQGKQAAGKEIKIFLDATARPIIHLLPEYMRSKSFTDADIKKITNGKASSINTSLINGVTVTSENITCKNGYIHKVAEVIEPMDNMAEIVRNHPKTKIWSHLMDRFSAPYYNESTSKEYNRLYGTNDSVFTLHYFSPSTGIGAVNLLPDRKTVQEHLLLYDPGWNMYHADKSGSDYHNDAGAMLVPTDDAMTAWWMTGTGSALRNQFKEWDSIPDNTLVDLINNGLLSEFANTIPSKFKGIVDDAQVSMKVTEGDVDSCFMGCNGMVYLTNKVFAPSSFSSVAFPAQIRDSMSVFDWTLVNVDRLSLTDPYGPFKSLLLSTEATYSLMLPNNNAMLTYIDPTQYGLNPMVLYEFYYDPDPSLTQHLNARRYNLTKDATTGQYVRSANPLNSSPSLNLLKNRLKDILNSTIIVGPLTAGQEYYKTRGGCFVRIQNPDVENTMTVAGGYQLEGNKPILLPDGSTIDNNVPIVATTVFTMGNGKSYELNTSVPMSATQSLNTLLKSNPNFSEFESLVNAVSLFTSSMEGNNDEIYYPNNGQQNFSLFDGYDYTVYVPNNTVIQMLQTNKYLPKASDLSGATSSKWGSTANANIAKRVIRERIRDFIRYHVQDNAIFVKGKAVTQQPYESAKVNPDNNRFYSMMVTGNSSTVEVYGQYCMNPTGAVVQGIDASGNAVAGAAVSIDNTDGQYNLMVREFWNQSTYKKSDSQSKHQADKDKTIYSSSNAVVHLLNGALFFSNDNDPTAPGGDATKPWGQLTNWEDEVKAEIAAAASSSRKR